MRAFTFSRGIIKAMRFQPCSIKVGKLGCPSDTGEMRVYAFLYQMYVSQWSEQKQEDMPDCCSQNFVENSFCCKKYRSAIKRCVQQIYIPFK